MLISRSAKQLLCITLTLFALHSQAAIRVLQFNSAKNSVTPYSVPLDRVDMVVTSGKFAWAVDYTDNKNSTSVSFFNGHDWETPTLFQGQFDQQSDFTANSDGDIVSASFSTEDQDGRLTNHVFGPSGSGKHSWDHLSQDWTKLVHGRLWKLSNTDPQTLYINQGLYSMNSQPITDAASRKIISGFDSASPQYKRYDASTNTDFFYMSSQSGVISKFVTCQVPHASTHAAQDVRCTMQSVNARNYIDSFIPSPDATIFAGWKKNGDPTIDLDQSQDPSHYHFSQYFAYLWQQGDNRSWTGKMYYKGLAEDWGSPTVNNVRCPLKVETLDQQSSLPVYSFPPSYVCMNVSSGSATQYTLGAKDLNKSQDQALSVATTVIKSGVLLTEEWVHKHNIYYVPFDKTEPQQELANIPDNPPDVPQYAAFAQHGRSPSQIVACGLSVGQDQQSSFLTLNVSELIHSKWTAWNTSPIHTNATNFNDCELSLPESSDYLHYDRYYANPTTIWLYPDYQSAPES